MSYVGWDSGPEVVWDRPGFKQGVTIYRTLQGQRYAWKVPFDGVVTQAMAADLLRVSVMSINNWVRTGKLNDLHVDGPSLIPLHEIKRVKGILESQGRLYSE
jgi:hypothetical protein